MATLTLRNTTATATTATAPANTATGLPAAGKEARKKKTLTAPPAPPPPPADAYAPFEAQLNANFIGTNEAGLRRGSAVVANIKALAEFPQHQLVYATAATMALEGKTSGYGGSVVHFRLAQELGSKLAGEQPFTFCQQLEANGFLRMGHGKKGTTLWFVSDLFDKPEPKGKKNGGSGSAVSTLVAQLLGGGR